jgi:hypothetical protein
MAICLQACLYREITLGLNIPLNVWKDVKYSTKKFLGSTFFFTEEGNDNYNIPITIFTIQKTESPNQSRYSGCAIQIGEVYDLLVAMFHFILVKRMHTTFY